MEGVRHLVPHQLVNTEARVQIYGGVPSVTSSRAAIKGRPRSPGIARSIADVRASSTSTTCAAG